MKRTVVLLAIMALAVPVLADGPAIPPSAPQRITGPIQEYGVNHNLDRATFFFDNSTTSTGYYWPPNFASPDCYYGQPMTLDGSVPFSVGYVEIGYGDPDGVATQVTIEFFNDTPAFTYNAGPDGTQPTPFASFTGTLPGAGFWSVGYTLTPPITIDAPNGASIVVAAKWDAYNANGPGPLMYYPPTVGFVTYVVTGTQCPGFFISSDVWPPACGAGFYWFGDCTNPLNPSAAFYYRLADSAPALACPGDMNCDGAIDFADIDPFVAILSGSTPCNPANADVNGDGNIDFADIDPFVALLASGATCP